MTALGEQSEHDGFRFCWFQGSLQTVLGHDALNTSKIHSKFTVFLNKHNLNCALTVSHTCTTTYGKKIEKFSATTNSDHNNSDHNGLLYLTDNTNL